MSLPLQAESLGIVPERRTPQDVAADRAEFVRNMEERVYESWPNEAGVSHLTPSLNMS